MVGLIWAKAERSHREPSERDKIWIKRLHPACPASLDTLKVSVPPAVKLAAAKHARPALSLDIFWLKDDPPSPASA